MLFWVIEWRGCNKVAEEDKKRRDYDQPHRVDVRTGDLEIQIKSVQIPRDVKVWHHE